MCVSLGGTIVQFLYRARTSKGYQAENLIGGQVLAHSLCLGFPPANGECTLPVCVTRGDSEASRSPPVEARWMDGLAQSRHR